MSKDSRQQAARRNAEDRMSGTGTDDREREELDAAVQADRDVWARATECSRPQAGRAMTEHKARQDPEAAT